LDLTGTILSIYEKTVVLDSSFQSLSEKAEGIIAFHEIILYTGKEHGAVYTADPLWIEPVLSLISESYK